MTQQEGVSEIRVYHRRLSLWMLRSLDCWVVPTEEPVKDSQ